VTKRLIPKARPERIRGDVRDNNGLFSIGCRAARSNARADLHSINRLCVFFGKAWRGAVPQGRTIRIKKKNGAEHVGMPFLDLMTKDFEDPWKRGLRPYHPQYCFVELG
jgi:hypothetical protein